MGISLSREAILTNLKKFLPRRKYYEWDSIVFFEHLHNSGQLVLQGPPSANRHTVNYQRAKKWIEGFCTDDSRRIAQLVVDNIIYISHKELIDELQVCIDKILTSINLSLPVYLEADIHNTTQSNYYISVLFAVLWQNRGLRLDGVVRQLPIPDCNVINVDDCMYSGGQAKIMLQIDTQEVLPYFRTDSRTDREILDSFRSLNCNWYIVRPFITNEAITLYDGYKDLIFHHTFIVSRIIPTLLEQLGEEDYEKLHKQFKSRTYITTAVYFDHKVADLVSTTLNAIGYGGVPENNGCPSRFVRFIDECPETMPEDAGLSAVYNDDNPAEFSQERRCPYAWYKKIDWFKGTVLP